MIASYESLCMWVGMHIDPLSVQKDCLQEATRTNISMTWIQDWDFDANSEGRDGDRGRDEFLGCRRSADKSDGM